MVVCDAVVVVAIAGAVIVAVDSVVVGGDC